MLGKEKKHERSERRGRTASDGKAGGQPVAPPADRPHLLAKLSAAFQTAHRPDAVMAAAARVVCEHIGVSGAAFGAVGEGQVTLQRAHRANSDGASDAYRLNDFTSQALAHLKQGRLLAVADVQEGDTLLLKASTMTEQRAVLVAPVVQAGQLEALLVLHRKAPHLWAGNEKRQAEQAAEHAWLAVEKARAEEQLRQSKGRFVTAFQGNPVAAAIATTDEIRFLNVNDSFLYLTGYDREEVIGHTAAEIALPVPSEGNEETPSVLNQENLQVVGRLRTKSGDARTVLVSVGLIEIDGASALLTMFQDITDQKRLEREVQEISEREQRRIGQNLHDELGQQLAGLSFMCQTLHGQMENEGAQRAQKMERIADMLGEALSYTRDLSRLLAPVELEAGGLLEALRRLVDKTRTMYEIQCQLEADESLSFEDQGLATQLYRITQEAVNNAARHGQASRIVVELEQRNRTCRLCVRDNGTGIPEDALQEAEGMGLRTMQYRASLIGGMLDARRGDEGGTVVTCTLDT